MTPQSQDNSSPSATVASYERASDSHDLNGVLSLVAPGAVYFFSNKTAYLGKLAIGAAIARNFGAISEESYRLENVRWLAESESVAVCIYDYHWSGVITEQRASGSGRGTTVLQRSPDGWRVVHEHLSAGDSGVGPNP
ncbi:MAG: nuclear transport factor 2 family protein [Myxococcales bacterium]|nr:nuclear transport factor 2 family protein [Myxococcales bacterium]